MALSAGEGSYVSGYVCACTRTIRRTPYVHVACNNQCVCRFRTHIHTYIRTMRENRPEEAVLSSSGQLVGSDVLLDDKKSGGGGFGFFLLIASAFQGRYPCAVV